jgi:hypothetical protein
LRSLEKEKGAVTEGIDPNIPNYKQIEDHKQAKEAMKNYLEKLKETTETLTNPVKVPETPNAIYKAKEILGDPKFIQQKGVRSINAPICLLLICSRILFHKAI